MPDKPISNNSASSSPASLRPKPADTPALETLQEILTRFNIGNYDVLLVGDGSGSKWTDPCGWATVLVDRQTRGRQIFHGGMSAGSINLAELMPYLHALTWYHANAGRERFKGGKTNISVHVITDSQVTAQNGAIAANPQLALPKTNPTLWAAMRQFAWLGYSIEYHWEDRSGTVLNWACDLLASQARSSVMKTKVEPVRIEPPLEHYLEMSRRYRGIVETLKEGVRGQPMSYVAGDELANAADAIEELVKFYQVSLQSRVNVGCVSLQDTKGQPISPYDLNPDQPEGSS